ncbi:hypothetical protein ACM66B_001949 [Microbotryomycetes sp. NB124-2]
MNAAANLLGKQLGNHPAASTADNANPSNEPDKFADPSGEKMLALAWFGKGDVRMVESAKPRVVDPTDAVIKVTGTTVCGSDLHLLHGALLEMRRNDILGHEAMGIVESVGDQVTGVKVGDRVVASFNLACGSCFMCQQKLSSACSQVNSSNVMQMLYGNRTSGMSGYSHLTGGWAGGQSEFMRVPFASTNLLPIPDSVPDESALYLSDVLVTSYHQVVDSGVKQGDVVAIWGAGPIGVFCAKWSLLKGASRIIVIDNVPWRLEYVKEKLGDKIELLNFDEHKDVAARVNELTKGGTHGLDPTRPEGVDVALECAAGEYAKSLMHKVETAIGLETDTSEILNEMILSVRPFGTVGVTGVYAGFVNHLNMGAVMQKGVRLIGNGQAPVYKYWKEILDDYLVTGKVDPRDLIVSHRIPLEDTAKCYTEFDKREKHIFKVFIETKFSSPPSDKAPQTTRL